MIPDSRKLKNLISNKKNKIDSQWFKMKRLSYDLFEQKIPLVKTITYKPRTLILYYQESITNCSLELYRWHFRSTRSLEESFKFSPYSLSDDGMSERIEKYVWTWDHNYLYRQLFFIVFRYSYFNLS